MAAPGEHTHHIKIRSTQMEMSSAASNIRDDDFDRKLKAAQEDLDRIQLQREDLERKKRELEELTERKHTFISQQIEFTEKLTSALTLIDRSLFEIRQEADDLDQCRVCFASHLDKIQKINPENWSRENQSEKLEKAFMTVDIAADEYDQAAGHFEGSRSGAIFGRTSKRGRAAHRSNGNAEFIANLRNGFAFNLPLVVIGGLALLAYLYH
jgi:DNA repair exonuclease SbcCD ATPase subunit